MNTYTTYYDSLVKPSFAPPDWVFGPVWTFLYILIFFSFGKVFLMYYQKKIPFKIMFVFLLNLFFNLIFTPIQFGLQNNLLSLIDVILVLITLIFAMFLIYPYSKMISYLQIPYLLWGTFASILQAIITYLNW